MIWYVLSSNSPSSVAYLNAKMLATSSRASSQIAVHAAMRRRRYHSLRPRAALADKLDRFFRLATVCGLISRLYRVLIRGGVSFSLTDSLVTSHGELSLIGPARIFCSSPGSCRRRLAGHCSDDRVFMMMSPLASPQGLRTSGSTQLIKKDTQAACFHFHPPISGAQGVAEHRHSWVRSAPAHRQRDAVRSSQDNVLA